MSTSRLDWRRVAVVSSRFDERTKDDRVDCDVVVRRAVTSGATRALPLIPPPDRVEADGRSRKRIAGLSASR
ncbi:MAG: hypothetical protein OEO82_03790, partial [Gammaproteobacteria bacterium]|nr:hypothetical protein [Gammaproteobacteria bacterium]